MNSAPEASRAWPLLRVMPSVPHWVVGGGVALVVCALGSLAIALAVGDATHPLDRFDDSIVSNVLNAVTIGYIVATARHSLTRLSSELGTIRAHLLPAFADAATEVTRNRRPRRLAAATLAGLAFGFAMTVDEIGELVPGYDQARVFAWIPVVLPLLWTAIFHAFATMLENARYLSALGARRSALGARGVRVTLHDLAPLDVFANAGIRHLTMIVVGLAVIPVQTILTGDISWIDFVPALSVSVPMAAALLLAPIWGVHRGIVAAKRAELERLDATIGLEPPASADAFVRRLYRHEVARTPEWPLSGRNVARVVGFALLPPLAWSTAAVVESLVSRFIG
jgi:hypothetical protein